MSGDFGRVQRLELRQEYARMQQSADFAKRLEEAQNLWNFAEVQLEPAIREMVECLEESVCPLSRFTRYAPSMKGSKLNLKGVIRYIMTNGNYSKLFKKLATGGKREHAICLALDLSSSMKGAAAELAKDAMAIMIAALARLHLDNFSIVTFGQQTRLVKAEDQAWDARAIHQFLSCGPGDQAVTLDADAVELCTDLLVTSPTLNANASKQLFVFTDGYGTGTERLHRALRYANRVLWVIFA